MKRLMCLLILVLSVIGVEQNESIASEPNQNYYKMAYIEHTSNRFWPSQYKCHVADEMDDIQVNFTVHLGAILPTANNLEDRMLSMERRDKDKTTGCSVITPLENMDGKILLRLENPLHCTKSDFPYVMVLDGHYRNFRHKQAPWLEIINPRLSFYDKSGALKNESKLTCDNKIGNNHQ